MNKNIFENAYFGKPYKTRNGRKAVYWKVINGESPSVALLCEDFLIDVNTDGIIDELCFGDTFPNKHDYDIVSEWQEEINEDELNKLADEYCGTKYFEDEFEYNRIQNAFNAGVSKRKK